MKSKKIGQDKSSDNPFAALLEKSLAEEQSTTPGTPVLVTVSNNSDRAFVFVQSEFGAGIISRDELLDDNGDVRVSNGEKIQAWFSAMQNGERLFTTQVSGPASKSILQNAFEHSVPIEGRIARQLKGGYEISFGDEIAFCPASQLGEQSETKEPLWFLIRELADRRVVVSRRDFLDRERERQKQQIQESLAADDIVTGRVTSLQSFGAFVDIGGMEGLVPISELSWKRIGHARDVVKSGDELRLKVIDFDPKEDRLTLSLRAMLQNPWQGELPFALNEIVEATVEGVRNFGIFMGLGDGFTGLVPLSESGVPRGQSVEKEFEHGAKCRVMVLAIDRERGKITLSVSRVADADQRKEYEQYMAGSGSDGAGGEQISSFGQALLDSLNEKKK